MAPSKRIQVILKDKLTSVVEDLAEQQGNSMSKMCSILVEEALNARGLNPYVPDQTPVENPNIKWAVNAVANKQEAYDNTAKADAQVLKLKLMQELMDQIKQM